MPTLADCLKRLRTAREAAWKDRDSPTFLKSAARQEARAEFDAIMGPVLAKIEAGGGDLAAVEKALAGVSEKSADHIALRYDGKQPVVEGAPLQNYTIMVPGKETTLTVEEGTTAEELQRLAREKIAEFDAAEGKSFSLGPASMLDDIADSLDAKRTDPKERLAAFEKAAEDVRGMARAIRFNESTAEALSAREIERERAARRGKREDELMAEVDRDFGDLSGTEFISKAMNSPLMDALFTQKPGDKFPRSMIQSRTKAESRGRDVGGSYDGATELPRWIFGGSQSPDVIAQNLYDEGLLKSPDPDALWNGIASALKTAGAAKDRLRKYGERRAAAREQAATEAREWADKKLEALPQRKAEDAQADMLRYLVALDSILMKFPAEVRAKVGGFIKLASLKTDKARAAFLRTRIEKLDRVLEKFLQGEYRERLDDLIARGQPNAAPGEKSKGKIGPEAHRFFAEVQAVAGMDVAEVEARQAALDAQLAAPDLTDEQAADIFEKQQITDTFGNLAGKSAQEMAAALVLAQEVFTRGRNRWRIQEEMRLAGVQELADSVLAALGAGTYTGTQAKKGVARRAGEKLKGAKAELQNFAGFLRGVLGEDHPLAKKWADAAREGYAFSEDKRRELRKEWDAAVQKATGKKGRAGRLAVWNMANEQTLNITLAGESKGKTETIPSSVVEKLADGVTKPGDLGFTKEEADSLIEKMAGSKPLTIRRTTRGAAESVGMTEAEGIFVTMLAGQEQYAAALDAAGFTAEAVQSIEDALSDGAKVLRGFMRDKYREGYAPLNAIFARMFGVDLPQIENYAPASFYHTGDDKAKGPDDTIPEGGFRAGFLKNRKRHNAAPRLENAFASFFGHQAQMNHWQGFAEMVREMRGVIGKPEVKRSIEAAHGKEMLALLNDWVKALEGNGIQKAHGMWEAATGWLLKQAAYIQLGWKLGTLMVQSTAALGSLYRIPAGAYFRGMGRLLAGDLNVMDMWRSPTIQNRLENGFAPEVRAALSDMWGAKPSLRQDFLEKGMHLIGFVDAVFTTASAAIAHDYHHREALKAGMSESQAKAAADDATAEIVSETAQPATVPNRSLFELKQGNLGKLAFMYASEARQKAALLINAWGKTLTGRATGADVKVLILAHLVIGPMIQAIRNAWWDARDDDDDELFDEKHWQDGRSWLRAMAMGPLSGVPLLNDIFSQFDDSNAAVGRFKEAGENAARIFEGPAEGNKENVEFYWNRIVKILQGLDAATATAAGVADQVFKVADNFVDDTGEAQAKVKRAKVKARKEAKEAAAD